MAKDNVPHAKAPRNEGAKEIRGIVHLIGKDVKGQVPLIDALRQVKGIGFRLSKVYAKIISKEMNVPLETPIGKFTEEQIDMMEEMIKSPSKYKIPSYLLNRRKDLETGKDLQIAGNDVVFTMRSDVERQKTLYTWRGYRHAYGQKVRGQGTRTTGRKGLTMGVAKSKIMAAAKPAVEAKPAAKAAAPAKK